MGVSLSSPPPEVRRWGNLKETLLRFQRTHDFSGAFEALTVGEPAGDYFSALGTHRQELLRQHVSVHLHVLLSMNAVRAEPRLLWAGVSLPQCLPVGQRGEDRVL